MAEAGTFNDMISANTEAISVIHSDLNQLWFILSASLVFFMQGGFGMVEAGVVRGKNVVNILFKNLLDCCASGLLFWAVGWAFAYGGDRFPEDVGSQNGFIGVNGFFLEANNFGIKFPRDHYGLWLFQWAFSATSATIVSGSVAERTQSKAYVIFSCIMSGIIYPVVAHWCWSTAGWISPFTDPKLFTRVGTHGVLDFAGSGVVHLTGGTAGLVAACLLGSRLGRFPPKGTEETVEMRERRHQAFAPHNKVLGFLGTIILWFGWYGFNCGSTLALSKGASLIATKVAIVTTLGGVAGGLAAVAINRIRKKYIDMDIFTNGVLCGLVSITAGCALVDPWAGVVIGGIGGCGLVGATELLIYLRIDDPVGAVPVHFTGGMWGLISVGLFTKASDLAVAYGVDQPTNTVYGLLYGGGAEQLGVQILAVGVIVGWSAACSVAVFFPLWYFGMLRVDTHTELYGIDIVEHRAVAYGMESTYQQDMAELHSSNRRQLMQSAAEELPPATTLSPRKSFHHEPPPAAAALPAPGVPLGDCPQLEVHQPSTATLPPQPIGGDPTHLTPQFEPHPNVEKMETSVALPPLSAMTDTLVCDLEAALQPQPMPSTDAHTTLSNHQESSEGSVELGCDKSHETVVIEIRDIKYPTHVSGTQQQPYGDATGFPDPMIRVRIQDKNWDVRAGDTMKVFMPRGTPSMTVEVLVCQVHQRKETRVSNNCYISTVTSTTKLMDDNNALVIGTFDLTTLHDGRSVVKIPFNYEAEDLITSDSDEVKLEIPSP